MKTNGKTNKTSNKQAYLEAMALAERLHRQFLDQIETGLREHGVDDINSVQALMLFNIGEEQPLIGELIKRGYYLGTNATYNVQKMVEAGYVSQERSAADRRAFRIKLSPRGKQLWQILDAIVTRQSEVLLGPEVSPEFVAAYSTLQRLEGAGHAA